MKNVLILILLLTNVLYTSKAQSSNTYCPKYPLKNEVKTVISGLFPDSVTIIDIEVVDHSKPKGDSSSRVPYKLNAPSGKFSRTISIKNPVYIYFKQINHGVGSFSAFNMFATYWICSGILVEPGDSIYIDASRYNTYEELKVLGKGFEKHQCYQEILKKTNLYSRPSTDAFMHNNFNPEFRDSIINMVLNTVNSYKHKLSKPAISIIKANTAPLLLIPDIPLLIAGSRPHGYKAVVGTQLNTLKTYYKEKYLPGMNRLLDIQEPSLVFSETKFDQLTLIPQAFSEYLIDANRSKDLDDYFVMYKYFPESAIKYRALGNYIIQRLKKEGGLIGSKTEEVVNSYVNDPKVPEAFQSSIFKRFKELEKIKAGNQAYPFELPDTTGKLVRLSDFKGKVVLIDFMYTLCGGCRAMVPKLTEMERHFKNEDVAFVAISVEKEIKGWKEGIGISSSNHAIQLYTNGLGYRHPLIEHYGITAFPVLVLIDKQGNVVTSRAPDPRKDDGKALITMIEKELN